MTRPKESRPLKSKSPWRALLILGRVIVLAGGFLLSGCVAPWTASMAKYATENGCPREKIIAEMKMYVHDGYIVQVRGCGTAAVYKCNRTYSMPENALSTKCELYVPSVE